MAKLINIDNGGTLTDIWVLDGDKSYHSKTITTPYDLSKCFFEGLKKISQHIYGFENITALLQSTDHIRYSTTQGTNALVMKKGPRLGLIVDSQTDVGNVVVSDKEHEMFEALVDDRVEYMTVEENDEDYKLALLNAVNHLASKGANRIVVAFDGPEHLANEARFRRVSLALFPRHLLGAVPMLYAGSLSSDSNYQRRTWTAIKNAFLHPSMERFLFNAENKLREYRLKNPLLIYRNDGYAGRVAKTVAIKTYSSGPRAGMESAREYANYYGFDNCLTMDVGGTTTDIGLIEKGIVRASDRGEVEGVRCSFPMCDIVSIGVGGGSIIRVGDQGITVGPDSVGGMPGPACFGLGGKEPTITDALLLMGLLDPKTYFGGDMNLDLVQARLVVDEKIAMPLEITVEQAVHQMFAAWAQNIAKGLADFTALSADMVLSAFGGGGPMGVLAVAQAAGINRVLVPRLSAVFSAHGIGFSDIAHMFELRLREKTQQGLTAAFQQVVSKVTRDIYSEGFELEECRCDAWLMVNDKRYPLMENNLVLPSNINTNEDISVGFRAVKSVHRAKLPPQTEVVLHPAVSKRSRELVNMDGTATNIPVICVEDQTPGAEGYGPAVIEEKFWTCKVESGWYYHFTVNGDVVFDNSNEVLK